jgi:hydroxyacylglutathione hydrolase
MQRISFSVGLLECNCTILADERSREAVIIDPGDEADRILQEIRAQGLHVVKILHTHAHIDHIGATESLRHSLKVPIYLHAADHFLYAMMGQQARMFGLPDVEAGPIDHELADGQALWVGQYECRVIHTPGHSPGSVCFYFAQEHLCIAGDTLFCGGVGRTDLWGGDYHVLQQSIRTHLYAMPGDVQVVPGHGPETNIERERRTNPVVRGSYL